MKLLLRGEVAKLAAERGHVIARDNNPSRINLILPFNAKPRDSICTKRSCSEDLD